MKLFFTRHPLRLLALALSAVLAAAAYAASETSEPPEDEVFVPTEEISEDFAISFPVDI